MSQIIDFIKEALKSGFTGHVQINFNQGRIINFVESRKHEVIA